MTDTPPDSDDEQQPADSSEHTPEETAEESAVRDQWAARADSAGEYGRILGEHAHGSVRAASRFFATAGRTFGRGIVTALQSLGRASSSLPLGEKFWRGMLHTSIDAYHNASQGDALSINGRADRVEFLPVKWQDGEEVDEKRGWKAKNRDKVWSPGNEGRGTTRISKTPLILTDQDAPQKYTFCEARVAEAIDMGRYQPLYKAEEVAMDAEINSILQGQPGEGGAAVADGGANLNYSLDINPDRAKELVLADTLVDIAPGSDYDGMRVSTTKVKELYQEKTGSEYQKQAETRGYLAGMSREDMKQMMVRLFMIAGLIVLGAVLGPHLIDAFFGGGGGGGGGISLPFI